MKTNAAGLPRGKKRKMRNNAAVVVRPVTKNPSATSFKFHYDNVKYYNTPPSLMTNFQ